MNLPVLPEDAPFTPEQRAWISGYLAGLLGSGEASVVPSRGPITFLYGSQTGGAEGLARRFAREAKKAGFEARAVGMEQAFDLGKESRIGLVTSTYGDGEMPDNAQAFWETIKNGSAPELHHLEFSVLALGDRNYVRFCEAGKQFDHRFAELGARRVHERVECDVDYEQPARDWFDCLMAKWRGGEAPARSADAAEPTPFGPSKANPHPAVLKTNRVLNAPRSTKETRHLEILLEGEGLAYEAGDALGIVPTNCPEFVAEILAAAGLDGGEETGEGTSLRAALTENCDLKPFLTTLPARGTAAADLLAPLRRLQPRLYSISSSPKAHPGEVHLTVAIVRYEHAGRARKGVCSTFLADRVGPGTPVPVYIHRSAHFRLPADGAQPVIMVGPGTGIAPFRAFLEERRVTGAPGRNWLFFGDQHAATDFLYGEELAAMQKDGTLHRLDLAFSRDQTEKIYVQDRMLEQTAELWAWLQEGASFYVCGDARRMAKDVDAALHRIAQDAGGLSPEAAAEFVNELKTKKRYLRDVY